MISAPAPPVRILSAVLPIMILSRALPVPSIADVPCKVRFSRLFPNVSLTVLKTLSIPSFRFSVILSEVLST